MGMGIGGDEIRTDLSRDARIDAFNLVVRQHFHSIVVATRVTLRCNVSLEKAKTLFAIPLSEPNLLLVFLSSQGLNKVQQ